MSDQTSPVFPWAIAVTSKIDDSVDADSIIGLSVIGANTPGETLILWGTQDNGGETA
jgi:hypothetical protein